jgi:N-acetylglucosaminyldiphosphoundecaprenol N-acetyl-beta-D-mannosaminyltransferase
MIDNRVNILGVGVSGTPASLVLKIINGQCSMINHKKPYFVVTAYSEFFLEAQSNPKFKQALDKADLIVADGVSVVAAMDYVRKPSFLYGLYVGWKIISGQYYGQTVVGVDLVQKILEDKSKKVFLLGGWNGVAKHLAKKYNAGFMIEPIDIKKINDYKPDILFVALGRFKQEIWIADNLEKLNCKVIMGVGSSFDELAKISGWESSAPLWINKMGLKWLWRAIHNPKHWSRALRASILFPWKIWRNN